MFLAVINPSLGAGCISLGLGSKYACWLIILPCTIAQLRNLFLLIEISQMTGEKIEIHRGFNQVKYQKYRSCYG